MEDKNTNQDPAFPTPDYVLENSGVNFNPMGMSKRFYAACAAMQGLLSNPVGIKAISDNVDTQEEFFSEVIKSSYDFADELLKQENA